VRDRQLALRRDPPIAAAMTLARRRTRQGNVTSTFFCTIASSQPLRPKALNVSQRCFVPQASEFHCTPLDVFIVAGTWNRYPTGAPRKPGRAAVAVIISKEDASMKRIIHPTGDNSVTSEELLERLRLALEFSEIGEWTWNAKTDAVNLSALACEILGLAPHTEITWQEMQARLLHKDDAPRAATAMVEAIERHSMYRAEYRVHRPMDGRDIWVSASGKARYEADGSTLGMIGVLQDVTERKLEQLALSEEAETLDILNRTGAVLASELDVGNLVQAVTDAGTRVIGAEFGAFFYNVVGPSGEEYMLYALSGAERERFAHLPMPRNTHVFAPTFNGEATVRSDDITKDPRYGRNDPYCGMPKGHLPVCSYLAVPVISRSGEVIGGLFFGHSQPGMFSARDERVLVGISAQAAVAIDNGRLYQRAQREITEKQKAEDALRALATDLEERVQARTAELEASYAQLKREVEERERTEEVLRHAQKLEAIGQLTGGVAHDFNNLLTIVIGNVDTIARRLGADADTRLRRAVEHALEGARKAAALTQRLLAFARRQPLKPEPIDPNRLVQQMPELLYRTLGERVEIETVLAAGVWTIEVDAGQLESAIVNLAVNARDAMADGGKLTIETGNSYVDEPYAREHAITSGQYVAISVSDTGTGIPRAVIDRVFDPFFTTKGSGHGTGLGLSQVYGFVKQSGGNVRIYSEPGEGTTVKLYLPRYAGKIPSAHSKAAHVLRGDHHETILVVEDEERVRQLSVSLLQELGYEVIAAPDGPAALAVLERTRVDLLFTDVGLPRMNGRQLADEARKRYPQLKVLFTTGYAKNAIVHHGRLDADVQLVVKPFTFAELSEKVRTVLDA
jgi:PAS domain S-box-containing protein